MSRTSLVGVTALLILAFTAPAAVAAEPPPPLTIFSVQPDYSPPEGGQSVFVVFSGAFHICVDPGPGCEITATFDGIPAKSLNLVNGGMVLTTPAHARGEVVLAIHSPEAGVLTTKFHYATEDDFDRVLLPVATNFPLPGALGSIWATDIWAATTGGAAVTIRANSCSFGIDPLTCSDFLSLSANGSPSSLDNVRSTNATFIYIPKWTTGTSINLRVRDLSRQSQTWGTTVPVVSTSEYRSDMQLLNLPTDSRFRVTLRIYGPDSSPTQARIRIFRMLPEITPAPLVDEVRALPGIVSIVPITFPTIPSLLQLGFETWPALLNAPTVRVEVSAVDSGLKLWAFASVTNNETQHVTVVTP